MYQEHAQRKTNSVKERSNFAVSFEKKQKVFEDALANLNRHRVTGAQGHLLAAVCRVEMYLRSNPLCSVCLWALLIPGDKQTKMAKKMVNFEPELWQNKL